MSLKKMKVISVFAVFALTVLFHFLYEWLPNPVFAVLFPVNESIWEHMKLLYSGFLAWGFIEYYLLKRFKEKFNNYWSSLFLMMVSSIIAYLILYLPLYSLFGENMFISIGLLILVIILEEIFSYYLLRNKEKKVALEKASIFLIILGYAVFLALTYYPLKNYIFYDTNSEKYGIDIYETQE